MYENSENLQKQAVKAHKVRQMNNVDEVTCVGVVIMVNCGFGIQDIEQLTKGDYKIDQIHTNIENNDVIVSLYPDN
jgi:hypothetical protein